MFTVDPNPKFTHTVKVKVPVDGGFAEQSCKATFWVLPTDVVAEYDLTEGKGSTEFLRRALHPEGLTELVDSNKQPVDYNHEVRDQLLALPYFRSALARTYFEAVSGARAGN